MGMSSLATPELLAFAETLADAAGEILLKYYRTPIPAERKADTTPVTVADREAEAVMRDLIHARYPDHGIFGEEHARINPDAPMQWVLDPIDGTRSYLAGYPTFTTLIALCRENIPVLGIIDQPFLKERWSAAAGRPTMLNGSSVMADPPQVLGEATLATTSGSYFNDAQRKSLDRLRARCRTTVMGGDAYAYAMLASGNLSLVVDVALKPYDFCALVPVIEGAGGIITDWSGKKLTMNSDGSALASSGVSLHEEALSLLADL